MAAVEVEDALARHPAVHSAYVVGVAHPTRGENVAAFVVLYPNQGATADDLRAFCREQLASYKVPRHIFLIDEGAVPRTGTGKVEKRALRTVAEARVSGEGS